MVLLSENALPGVDGRWKSSKHGGVKTIQGGVGVPQLLDTAAGYWEVFLFGYGLFGWLLLLMMLVAVMVTAL